MTTTRVLRTHRAADMTVTDVERLMGHAEALRDALHRCAEGLTIAVGPHAVPEDVRHLLAS